MVGLLYIIGFICFRLEPTSPTKVFKPLTTNPEDIPVSNASAQDIEGERFSMRRYETGLELKVDDDEKKAEAEAQRKPPFAG